VPGTSALSLAVRPWCGAKVDALHMPGRPHTCAATAQTTATSDASGRHEWLRVRWSAGDVASRLRRLTHGTSGTTAVCIADLNTRPDATALPLDARVTDGDDHA